MTPTQQAGPLLLAALISLFCGRSGAQVPQDTPVPQQPAPVIRVNPQSSATTTARPQSAAPSPRTVPRTPPSSQASPSGTATAPKLKTTASTTGSTSAEHKPATSTTSSGGLNRGVIVLDPSHGGTDSGARIGDSTLEKNVTLALAFRLRSLLTARGFTVQLTRDSDTATESNSPATPLTLDDRAGMANHARAAACLLLHATGRGTGVHLYSSDLDATPGEPALAPWLTAQAAWIPASQALEQQMGAALGRSHIALVSSTASVRPVDSLTCPALAIELAPESDDPDSINSADYQERVASAIAGALVFWKDLVQPPPRLTAPTPAAHTATRHAAVTPPKPAPEAQP